MRGNWLSISKNNRVVQYQLQALIILTCIWSSNQTCIWSRHSAIDSVLPTAVEYPALNNYSGQPLRLGGLIHINLKVKKIPAGLNPEWTGGHGLGRDCLAGQLEIPWQSKAITATPQQRGLHFRE